MQLGGLGGHHDGVLRNAKEFGFKHVGNREPLESCKQVEGEGTCRA